MLLGGSLLSESVTFAATTVTVQTSFDEKFVSGFNVKVMLSDVDLANVCALLLAHEMVKAASGALTASLKVTLMFEPRATPVAPFVGMVLETEGAVSVGGAACGVIEKSST